MKKTTILMLFVLTGMAAMAQYKPVDKKSTIGFTIGNLGFDVKGTFTGISGQINFDPQTPATGSMNIKIDASTVNTDNSLRDKHLKDDNYFDVKDYPEISFVSNSISKRSGGYLMNGKLTIKGKLKDITIPFTAAPDDGGYLFKGSFKIKRKDFDIGGTSTISNELEVDLNIIAIK